VSSPGADRVPRTVDHSMPSTVSSAEHSPSTMKRLRYCGDCLAGEHDIDTDNWRTAFMILLRRFCICDDCDCTFGTVRIAEPRFDQRHHQPHVHRKSRVGGKHAA
jgi:hypothetical protein